MKTVRRPPYPKWNPGYFPCSSLTPPFRFPHAVHRCPSVDSGLIMGSTLVDVLGHRADTVEPDIDDRSILLDPTKPYLRAEF